jgi:hypothetical protein
MFNIVRVLKNAPHRYLAFRKHDMGTTFLLEIPEREKTWEPLGFDSQRGLGIFLFTTASRTALEPIQPPIQ